ncbi:DNA topoisomerase IB [Winogradskya consettensis]|uniref:DNA topoisomerase n=1 Tax=Winogradskya consettensis TaxID=113560 RepID=A0A919SPY2_9ACTN|nr:DNA topoisomerase IB [Actinoplanes consettensis]GIM74918.1 DNA topoisomerase [Actinoplanes consettensis]
MRLRRSDLTKAGYARKRRGTGFSYLGTDGTALRDAATIARIKALVIPPAWTGVWISTDDRGHIQATGQDAAGRKQYIYHPQWRSDRDGKKFDHAVAVAARLPDLRKRLCADLTGRGLSRARVLAAVVRLLDMGMFRVGSDQYAQREEDPTYGLSTLRPDHVHTRSGAVTLDFVGKSGKSHALPVEDEDVCRVLRALRRRRRESDRLFAYWEPSARRWHEVHADEINAYLREISGEQMSAKDFRTWHGTVKAAAELAEAGAQETPTGRKRAVSHAMKEVAELLGNTPAVARGAYVDPRVLDAYERGETADPPTEKAVLNLLTG